MSKENTHLDRHMNFWSASADTISEFFQQYPPGSERLEQLNNSTPAFQADLRALLIKHAMGGDFANEQRPSTCGYYSGYKSPKPIQEQLKRLQKCLPKTQLITNIEVANQPLPKGAEGYVAFPLPELFASTYGEALRNVLLLLLSEYNYKFFTRQAGKLGPNFLQPTEESNFFWEQVKRQQSGSNILIVPVQLGVLYRDYSANRARYLCTVAKQVGLGAFHVAVALLLHPERLSDSCDLGITCSGDKYSYEGTHFDCTPCFSFNDDQLMFGSSRTNNVGCGGSGPCDGSASAFTYGI